ASWNASANSARHAPNLARVRNQFIVVMLRASRTRQNHSAGPSKKFCNNITLSQLGRAAFSCDSFGVLQKINIAGVRLRHSPIAERAPGQRRKIVGKT